MRLFLLASFVVASAAAAAPNPPTPPTPPGPPLGDPPPMCKQSGPVLFTSDVVAVTENQPTVHIKVFVTGAWTSALTKADGGRGREASGCLPAATLTTVIADLDKAPWKVTRPAASCRAIGPTRTNYTVRGKAVWTDEMCPAMLLDQVSQTKLADVNAILADVSKPGPIETSRGKPVK